MKELISEHLTVINKQLEVRDANNFPDEERYKYDIIYVTWDGVVYYVATIDCHDRLRFVMSIQWLIDVVGLKLRELQKLERLGQLIEEGALC